MFAHNGIESTICKKKQTVSRNSSRIYVLWKNYTLPPNRSLTRTITCREFVI